MNSENLAMRVVGHLVDEYHNQCETLPASIDLHSNPPQLAVQHGQAAHPSARTNFKAADAHGRYNGRWTFLNGVLSMPDLALLGTPGQVQMTLSGGTRVTGGCITAHTLSLQLHPGSIAELRVSGWPPHSGSAVVLLSSAIDKSCHVTVGLHQICLQCVMDCTSCLLLKIV